MADENTLAPLACTTSVFSLYSLYTSFQLHAMLLFVEQVWQVVKQQSMFSDFQTRSLSLIILI